MKNSKFIEKCEKLFPKLKEAPLSTSKKSLVYNSYLSNSLDIVVEMEKAYPKEFSAFYQQPKQMQEMLSDYIDNMGTSPQPIECLLYLIKKIDVKKPDVANMLLRSVVINNYQIVYNNESAEEEINYFCDKSEHQKKQYIKKEEEDINYYHKLIYPIINLINDVYLEQKALGQNFFEKKTIALLESFDPVNDSSGIINLFTRKLIIGNSIEGALHKKLTHPLDFRLKELIEAEREFGREILDLPVVKSLMDLKQIPNNINYVMGVIANNLDCRDGYILVNNGSYQLFTQELKKQYLNFEDWDKIKFKSSVELEFIEKIKEMIAGVVSKNYLDSGYEGGEMSSDEKKIISKGLIASLKNPKSEQNKAINILNILIEQNLMNIKKLAGKSQKILESISRDISDFDYIDAKSVLTVLNFVQEQMGNVPSDSVAKVKLLYTPEGWNKILLEKTVAKKLETKNPKQKFKV